MFGLGIVLIIALGIGVVAMARSENGGLGDNSTPPKANLQNGQAFDHWHAAFAVEVCGKELGPLQDGPQDMQGIHTHGDGLVHIHPFTRTAAGKRATLERFFKQISFTVTDSGFELPKGMTMEGGGTTVKEGVTKCAGKDGELVLAHWKDAASAAGTKPDKIYRGNFPDVRFSEDLGAYTLAFVPKGSTDIDPPSSAADIESLGAADAGGSSSSGSGSSGGGSATVPVTSDPGTGG